jgi:hypothetical protein
MIFFDNFGKFFVIFGKKLEVDSVSFYQKSWLFISEVVKMYIQPLFHVELLSNLKKEVYNNFIYIYYRYISIRYNNTPLRAFSLFTNL